jgi:hypothetical protein
MDGCVAIGFKQEKLEGHIDEARSLSEEHWDEVGHYRDMPLDIDWEKYLLLERAGGLRVFSARAAHLLVGYALYLIGSALSYRTIVTAQCSTIYLHPEYRAGRLGMNFIKFTEASIKREFPDKRLIISQHCKVRRNFGPMLERLLGYELQDYVYTKVL